MPCSDVADAIVLWAREVLERTIRMVDAHSTWGGRVVYGDTDSLFVHFPGASVARAFEAGREIVATVNAMHPSPITLKLEKVYSPCFLVTKKRYVGYMYESETQTAPTLDAKGIECVRRDQNDSTQKIMEKMLHKLFSTHDPVE
eukprot:gene291-1775_t